MLLFNPAMALKAQLNSGYRNADYALAEIVDNSIEAHAKNIDIFIIQKRSKEGRQVWRTDNVNFQRFPTLDAKKLVNAPKMSAHHRGICHF